jgi:hypothetical protein
MAKRVTNTEAASEEAVESLREVVAELRSEIHFLYQAIDEFRTDFTHCLRNLPDNLPPPYAHLKNTFAPFCDEPISTPRASPLPVPEIAHVELTPIEPQEKVAPVAPMEEQVTTTAKEPISLKFKKNHRKASGTLYMRIVQQPILTDIVRLVGYECWSEAELLSKFSTLQAKYDNKALENACFELLDCKEQLWQLHIDARTPAAQILGKPKTN